MTTFTPTHDDRVRGGFPVGKALFLWGLCLVLGMVLFAVINSPVGRLMTDDHAVERHGEAEVDAIRKCFSVRGGEMVWVKKDDPSIKIFCVNLEPSKGCGMWATIFAMFWPSLTDGCDYKELTAFTPKDGSYHKVVDYLSEFARRLK